MKCVFHQVDFLFYHNVKEKFVFFISFSAAKNAETNEEVAIKKIGNAFDNRIDAKRTLREIKLLRHMDHENVMFFTLVLQHPEYHTLVQALIFVHLFKIQSNHSFVFPFFLFYQWYKYRLTTCCI